MYYDYDGKYFIAILMGIIMVKFFYMIYHIKKNLEDYNAPVYENFNASQSKKDTQSDNRQEYAKQQKPKKEKIVYAKIPDNMSRFSNDLKFFQNCSDPYRLLGCTPDASKALIRKSYRQLLYKWHPDRITGMGATQYELVQSTQIVQIINVAYKEACKNNTYAKSA